MAPVARKPIDEVEFGKRIKKFRELKKLTSKNVASQLGVAASTYREWEIGRAIQGLHYVKLAEILEVSLSELFGVAIKGKIKYNFRLSSFKKKQSVTD